MKCELTRSLMSSYIDKDINEIDRIGFEKHLQQCSECREEYEFLLEVVNDCNSIEEADLPEGFHEELHQKLVQEQYNTKLPSKLVKFINNYRWKAASGLVAAVLIIAIAINGAPLLNENFSKSEAGSSENSTAAADYDMANSFDTSYTMAAPAAEAARKQEPTVTITSDVVPKVTAAHTSADSVSVTFSESVETNDAAVSESPAISSTLQAPSRAASSRKVIKSGNITIKVANLDAKVNDIKSIAEGSGGYVENSEVSNNNINTIRFTDKESGKLIEQTTVKSANIVIRVPQEQFDSIFNNIKTMGKLENENVYGNDITLQYRDTEATVLNLKIKEQKLQELMTSKANTVDEILRIEGELNNVRTSIDIMSGDIKRWDDLVQLSSIYINITEVKETELEAAAAGSIWDKALRGFRRTIDKIGLALEKSFILFIASLPLILMFGIPLIILALIIKRKKPVRN